MINKIMQRETIPMWFKLLEHERRRLTLPFVIGALRESGAIPSDGQDFEQVYELFQDMADYRIPRSRISGGGNRVVYVQICSDLKVPVFSIWAEEYTRSCRARYPSQKPGKIHLCFSTEIEGRQAVDLRELTWRVFERFDHRTALSLKHYSRNGWPPEWRAFDERDRSAIHAALGQPQVE
jgi:hypothetical protein